MDTAAPATTTTVTTPSPVISDPFAIPGSDVATANMRTALPRVTRQQIKWERRQLKQMPKLIRKMNALNRLREQQEFTLNQQTEQAPDYSLLRGGPQYLGQSRAGSEGGMMTDPMAMPQAPAGPGAPAVGGWGPPINQFSPATFQPPMAMPSGMQLMPPSQSGVPGGLIYAPQPGAEGEDLSQVPIFEEEGEDDFADYNEVFAEMEPLDSYGAATGEPTQVSFLDRIGNLVGQAGDKYAAVQTAKYQAKYAKPAAPAPRQQSGAFSNTTLASMALILLGGWALLRAAGHGK